MIDDMVRRIDAAVEEGEPRTSFLRWCSDIGFDQSRARAVHRRRDHRGRCAMTCQFVFLRRRRLWLPRSWRGSRLLAGGITTRRVAVVCSSSRTSLAVDQQILDADIAARSQARIEIAFHRQLASRLPTGRRRRPPACPRRTQRQCCYPENRVEHTEAKELEDAAHNLLPNPP
jgi:hypothetical protein